MRSISRLFIVLSLVTSSLTLTAQQPSTAEALFQRGLLLERAEGNLTQAVVLYERVVAEHPKDTVVVPKALFHLARVYEQTDAQRASRMWTRLASEFGNTSYADEARRKLAAQQAQAAGPFAMRSLDTFLAGFDSLLGGWDISPDGRTVAYVKSDAAGDRLILRDLESGRDRQAVSEPKREFIDAWWSPDGQRVIFLSRDVSTGTGPENRSHEFKVLTVSNRQVRTIAKANFGLSVYRWSPDSQRVAILLGWCCRGAAPYTASGTIQIVNVSTGESRPVAGAVIGQGYGQMAWSPDSRELSFVVTTPKKNDEFRIANVDSGQVRALPTALPLARVTMIGSVWPTRDQIAFRQPEPGGVASYLMSSTDGSAKKICTSAPGGLGRVCGNAVRSAGYVVDDRATHRLMLLDPAQGTERRVTTGFGDEESPALSPDGRLLSFLWNPDGKWGLYVQAVDKAPIGQPVRLATLESHPTGLSSAIWNADGRLIASLDYNDENVYRISMDKSGRAVGPAGRLTQDSDFADSPVVSPDGQRIAYTGDRGIEIMTTDGAGERPVYQGQLVGDVEWISNEEVLFFNRTGPSTVAPLAALNINTGQVRDIAEPLQRSQYSAARREILHAPGQATTPLTIQARSIAGGPDRAIATIDSRGFNKFRVSPDGKQIAYGRWVSAEHTSAEIRILTIDSREDRLVATVPKFTPSFRSFSWSPDGRLLLYDEARTARLTILKALDVSSGVSWPISEATDSESQEWYDAKFSPDASYIVLTRAGWRTEYRAFDGVTYDAVVKLMTASGKK